MVINIVGDLITFLRIKSDVIMTASYCTNFFCFVIDFSCRRNINEFQRP